MTSDPGIEVRPAAPDELAESLKFLEGFLREGEPVPLSFVRQFRRAVETGELEVLAAWTGRRLVGVAVLAYRLSISAGATFASIEDLYVGPVVRRRGVGRVLLEAVEKRCRERGALTSRDPDGRRGGAILRGFGLRAGVQRVGALPFLHLVACQHFS